MRRPGNRDKEPGFFIVGAPKCGTSSLCHYLSQHPEVFFPFIKEPHFFGSDLTNPRGVHNIHEYRALFAESDGRLCGEGTTWYLYSQYAAREIYEFNPYAKIIIMLRNPVDLLYSWHSQNVYMGIEDIEEFEAALDAEPERLAGNRIPNHGHSPLEKLLYSTIPRFTSQIERYVEVFGWDQVHVIIYDDFKQYTNVMFQQTLGFLGVAPEFRPDFDIVNPNKRVRSKVMQDIVEHHPKSLQQLAQRLLPRKARFLLKKKARSLNTVYKPRPSMGVALRQRLQRQFTPEIEQLSVLLGRDLTHWVALNPGDSTKHKDHP
jgi:hypothetical protein